MKNWFVFFLTALVSAQLFSQRSNLQLARYTIQVSLDDRHHSLDGSLKLNYTNPSSDTLNFIWFQLWPNAFKNDRTAYSEKMLDSGRNDFYFSEKDQKGYINRLVFRSGNDILSQEDHPKYIDIIKVKLARSLPPGEATIISSSFHVQLPYNFSGFGHIGHLYNIQNWYPSVAAYYSNGWHPKPFTGQQQEVNADYEVSVTVPKKYVLQTNGQLLDSISADTVKTLRYYAAHVHDFVWSARRVGAKNPVPEKTLEDRISELAPEILSKKILPAAGYNVYDGLEVGVLVQNNCRAQDNKLTYYAAPMYAINSKTITGLAGVNYKFGAGSYFSEMNIGFNTYRASDLKGADSAGHKVFGSFYKIAPYVRFMLPQNNNNIEKWVELRTFIIGEKEFDYIKYSVDSFYYPVEAKTKIRYLNQVTFSYASHRSLYPYDAQLQLQQACSFYRLNGEAHYFFNYSKGGGLGARIFAAKFGYIGNSTNSDTYRYQPKLTAVRGNEDYTYGDAFLGRNEFSGFPAQQMMLRDGGFKLRTDLFQDLQGRSDNWVAAMNFNTTLPVKMFSTGFPLRIFLDAGSYAEAWKKENTQSRFLYVTGLQLSFFKNLLNVYAPVFYSKVFRDNLKTVPDENTFLKRISFSLDFNPFFRTAVQAHHASKS